jgi:hypothetical protein
MVNGALRPEPAGEQPIAADRSFAVKARKGSAHAPKHIKFVNELPMTGVGKVDKKVLKAGFRVGRERDGRISEFSPARPHQRIAAFTVLTRTILLHATGS